jgi:pimeloyl-ACP methyl ester carboxylesterase
VSSPARLRRAYFDCRYGQLHVHQAIPPGGGFDEAAPLLCIAGSEGTGRFFYPALGALGRDRTIYAPDLPGHGESDSAGAGAGAEQYALAFTDLLDSLRQRQVDVLAHAEGAETAIAIERLRPHALVRRMVLSAATPKAADAARSLKILFRELAPVGFSPDAAPIAPESLQLTELIEFFGTASHA